MRSMARLVGFLCLMLLGRTLMAEDVQFEMTIFIKSTPEKLWEALVSDTAVSHYFLCPLRTMGTAVGQPVEYGTDKAILISGVITAFTRNVELSHTFIFDPASHKGTAADPPTRVHYTLEAGRGYTQLTLVHEGFTERNQTFANVTGGWPWILSNLKTYLETGKALSE